MQLSPTKRCPKCTAIKPRSEFSRGGSRCKPCDVQHFREWKAKNPERWLARRKRWNEANREKVAVCNRKQALQNKYGLSLEEYESKLSAQGHKCAICGARDKRLVVDHNHRTGQVRELLCDHCNHVVGLLETGDKVALCMEYVARHNG